MLHRYVALAEWHRRQGSRLRPPSWRPPQKRTSFRGAAQDPDPGFTDWIQKVAQYLEQLDEEAHLVLRRLGQPVKVLRALAQAAEKFWFHPDKLRRFVEVRGETADQVDEFVNTLSVSLAVSNEYLSAVLQHADRIQSTAAQEAADRILSITHVEI